MPISTYLSPVPGSFNLVDSMRGLLGLRQSKKQQPSEQEDESQPQWLTDRSSKTAQTMDEQKAMAPAYSRVGRVPMYSYYDPKDTRGGFSGDRPGVEINLAHPDIHESINHEVAHNVLRPHIETIAKDPTLQPYIAKARQFLHKGGYPANMSDAYVASEILAFTTGGYKIGLTDDETQGFFTRAIQSVPQAHAVQYRQLLPKPQSQPK